MYAFQKKMNDLHISAFTSTTKSNKDINAKCTTVCSHLEGIFLGFASMNHLLLNGSWESLGTVTVKPVA